MSAERDIEGRANLDENAATVTETREVSELFNDDGELRLWEDDAGWNGYLREEADEGIAYYVVNTRHDTDDWMRKVRVGRQAVLDAVQKHIEDPKAGGQGHFVRRCSPP
jgi:hypothetical protein